jgi:hypothetical protein
MAVRLPVMEIDDRRGAPLIELTAIVLISADLEIIVEALSVDMVKEGSVGEPWMTGTHWPKLWMDDTLLLMYRGSETERAQ